MPNVQLCSMEPDSWKLERKDSALLLRHDRQQQCSNVRQKVCFRCDVEVREYERDEEYDEVVEPTTRSDEISTSPLAMCASCLAALCITIILPWFLISD